MEAFQPAFNIALQIKSTMPWSIFCRLCRPFCSKLISKPKTITSAHDTAPFSKAEKVEVKLLDFFLNEKSLWQAKNFLGLFFGIQFEIEIDPGSGNFYGGYSYIVWGQHRDGSDDARWKRTWNMQCNWGLIGSSGSRGLWQ